MSLTDMPLSSIGSILGRFWNSKRRQSMVLKVLATSVVALGAIVVIAPLIWMLSTSLKQEGRVLLLPPEWIPRPPNWSNYPEALSFMNAKQVYLNTIIITAINVIGQVASASLVAFGFARLKVWGRDLLFLLVLSTLMLPYQVTLIPQFILFRAFHWVDTFWPLIIPAFVGGPFFIFLMRQFYLSIPLEMDDAAKIDGCGYFGIYWRIILPLSKPALGVVAIQTFMNTWNDFLRPLIFLNSASKYTVALALRTFSADYGMTPWHLLMAASLVALLPCMILFLVAQRYFIQGIVITGIKG